MDKKGLVLFNKDPLRGGMYQLYVETDEAPDLVIFHIWCIDENGKSQLEKRIYEFLTNRKINFVDRKAIHYLAEASLQGNNILTVMIHPNYKKVLDDSLKLKYNGRKASDIVCEGFSVISISPWAGPKNFPNGDDCVMLTHSVKSVIPGFAETKISNRGKKIDELVNMTYQIFYSVHTTRFCKDPVNKEVDLLTAEEQDSVEAACKMTVGLWKRR